MKLIKGFTTTFDSINGFLIFIAAVLLIAMMLSINVEVVLRRFFGISILGLLECTEYSLLYLTFLGPAWLLKREGHVKMELVLSRLRPRTQALLNIITSIIGAITFLVIVRYSTEVTWNLYQTGYFVTSVLKPRLFFIMAIIPVGSFMLIIEFIRRTNKYIGSWRTSP